MGSLTAHLLETGDHGRLGFHPGCPVCRRERLHGSLSTEPVVSRRAQAALVSGVLALSAAAPVSAIAQETDLQQEGGSAVSPPDQPSSGESDDPGFEPGGDTALPLEVAPAPVPTAGEDPGADEEIVLESEPTEDPDALLVPQTEPEIAPAPDEEDATVPPVEPTPTAPLPDQATSPLDQDPTYPEAPAEDLDGSDSQEPEPRSTPKPGSPRSERAPDARSKHEAGRDTPVVAQPPPPAQRPETIQGAPPDVAPQPESEPTALSESAQESLTKGARSHVVQPGDSLWSIAARMLGPGASPAQIAREVNRLWSLNEDRIGTGDPDLLMVGATLRLR